MKQTHTHLDIHTGISCHLKQSQDTKLIGSKLQIKVSQVYTLKQTLIPHTH